MSKDANPDEKKSLAISSPATPSENSATKTSEPKDKSEAEEIVDIQSIPPQVQQSIRSFMAMFQSQIRTPEHPLFSKFTEAHVDKYLDYIQRDDDNAHKLRETNRWFYLAYFIIAIAVFSGFIVYLLPKDRDFLVQLITFLVLVSGGIGAGYGIKSREKD